MANYSNSKLSTFEQCRYKYKLEYIDGIEVETSTTVEAFLGDLVHRTLEKLYRDLKYQQMNSLKDLLAYYNKLWRKEWTDEIQITKSEYTKQNYRKMGEKFISDYYNHYKPFDQMTVIDLETQEMLPLPDGNNYHIRIDRLGCKGDEYYVCDYKTSSRLKDQEEAVLVGDSLSRDIPAGRALGMVTAYAKYGDRNPREGRIREVYYVLDDIRELMEVWDQS